MNGMSLISGVLFMAFMIAATAIVYWAAAPSMSKMQCAIAMDKMKASFASLDGVIQTVASEGEGSRRSVSLNVEEGEIHIDGDNDTIYWEYECNSQTISPRTMQTFGNVMFGSNMNSKAYEGVCSGTQAYVIENEHLKACFGKIGSEANATRYNMSGVLLSVYQKDAGQYMPIERLEITLDNNVSSATGVGYTRLSREGSNLPLGEVTAHMESDYGINYDVEFTLESGEDFLTIRGV
jgi:hypothetical protein